MRFNEGGRSGQERFYTVGGPSRSKESRVDAVAIASEPSWMHKHTEKWTNSQNYRLLAWRSPPNGDRRCSSHLSHHVRSMYEDKHCTASPSPQFACPQRDRKRLSREATLHAVLALEWPELVQIGRCKVQWPPTDLNKQILTSFWKYKTITQHWAGWRAERRVAWTWQRR